MNKISITVILVLISVVYIAFNYFINDESQIVNENNNNLPKVNVVQPLDIIKDPDSDNSEQFNKKLDSNINSIVTRKPRGNDEIIDEIEEDEILSNLGKNYVTLGEILGRPALKEGVMEDLVEDIQRAKYNLKISKQMAKMTKDIYYLDENGVRQMNQETLDKIHELRKKLIVKINFDIPKNED